MAYEFSLELSRILVVLDVMSIRVFVKCSIVLSSSNILTLISFLQCKLNFVQSALCNCHFGGFSHPVGSCVLMNIGKGSLPHRSCATSQLKSMNNEGEQRVKSIDEYDPDA